MDFAVVEILDEDNAIDISSRGEAREAAAHRTRERKAMQRRELASLLRSIKTMVRETD